FSLPANMFATVAGAAGANSSIVGGAAPAVISRSGRLLLKNLTVVGTGNAPTLDAEGGRFMLRDVIVLAERRKTVDLKVAVGAAADLGTPQDRGGNTIGAKPNGRFVISDSSNVLDAVGNNWLLRDRPVLNNYVIANHMQASNAPVMWVANQF